MNKKLLSTVSMLVLGGMVMASQAEAAGYYISEQSVIGVGASLAGEGARADHAATLWYNPAGMTQLPKPTLEAGGHVLYLKTKLTNNNTTVGGSGIAGTDGGNPYGFAFIPNLYYTTPVPNTDGKLWAGIGINSPFGLVSDYEGDDTFFGRFDSIYSELKTINIAPSIAYNDKNGMFPWLSVGIGVDIQYVEAKLKNRVPGVQELEVQLEGDDISVGANIGFLAKVADNLKLGLHYRSEMQHTLEGDLNVTVAANGTPAQPLQNITADLNLPQIASLSADWQIEDKWRLLASVERFFWSSFDKIEPISNGTPVANGLDLQNYKDTWTGRLGIEYRYSNTWTLSMGTAFDQSPVQDGFRSTRIPDEDRIWASMGASYKYSDCLTLDASYAHIFIDDAEVNKTSNAGAVVTRAKAESTADILSISARITF